MPGKWNYRDWEEAAKASPSRKAVAKIDIEKPDGSKMKAEIVKPLHGDGWIHYENSGIKIRKATAREVDSRSRWDDY